MANGDIKLAIDLLILGRGLISAPASWTKGALARDRHSRPVRPESEEAVCFCAAGALIRALADSDREISWAEVGIWEAGSALEDAFVLLGKALGTAILPLHGLGLARVLIAERVAVDEAEDPAKRLFHRLVVEGNDLPLVRHQHVLQGFDLALKAARAKRGR